ncbi:MAG: metallophosphoesterase family protein, partial [Calditrichaceae bacterium]
SSLSWCLEQLDEDDLDFLRSFQSIIQKSLLSDIELLCYHGSPDSNMEIILSNSEDSIYDNISSRYRANIFVSGHTHLQMKKNYKDKLFINPGSVGSVFPKFFMPGETPTLVPQAEYAIIRVEDGKISVIMRHIPFDTKYFKKFISNSNIPIKDWWLAQYC